MSQDRGWGPARNTELTWSQEKDEEVEEDEDAEEEKEEEEDDGKWLT